MQSNFFRYHFGLEWQKRKIVCRVHAKRILQTAPPKKTRNENLINTRLEISQAEYFVLLGKTLLLRF